MLSPLRAALALALTLCVASAASAASTSPPTQTPTGPDPAITRANEPASPGDPFQPTPDNGGSSGGGQTSPYTLTCEGFVNRDGSWTVVVTNDGEPIPPGNTVVVSLPGQQQMIWQVSTKWLPGQDRDMSFTEVDFLPAGGAFDCTASVHIKQHPNFDPNAPK